ncbi:hypothetical protein [Franconibacter helveticus]|uniref:hypothetical protein n=1 Tax=Franconibacter helveticus TaxID=357240 RepID=UPI001EF8019F|nr:hypothetical protein [Franconibacter helveticus]
MHATIRGIATNKIKRRFTIETANINKNRILFRQVNPWLEVNVFEAKLKMLKLADIFS